VLSAKDIEGFIRFARSYEEAQSSVDKDVTTVSTFSSLGFGGDAASSATSYTPDLHAVSKAEAHSTMQAYILSPHYFTARARSSGPCPGGLRPSAV
jgi:hypothetical protein